MRAKFKGVPFSPFTQLARSIGSGDTVIEVYDISVFPPAPNYATIGVDDTAETIIYNAIAGDYLSGCERGKEGVARSWDMDSVIGRNFTNEDYEALRVNVANSVQRETGNAADIYFLDGETFQDKLDAGALKGDDGEPGKDGEPGQDGVPGIDGKSAYEVAVEAGFVGTLEEWLASLKGEPGADGAPGRDGEPGQDGMPGENGEPGPNLISADTATPIVGLIMGNGESITTAIADMDYASATHAARHALGGEDEITPESIGAAEPSIALEAVLMAGGWVDKQQTLAVSSITPYTNCIIGIADMATENERNAARKALLFASEVSEDSITVLADGETPETDIPCTILVVK